MSLHRYTLPPPLALAIHPAPLPKPKKDDKDKDKKDDKDKDKDTDKKDDEDKDKKDDKDDKGKKDDNKQKDEQQAKKDDVKEEKEGVKDDKPKPKGKADKVESSPPTPGSMTPEPGTPHGDAPPTPLEDKPQGDETKEKDKDREIPAVPEPKTPARGEKAKDKNPKDQAKAKGESDGKDSKDKDEKSAANKEEEEEPQPEPEPIRLIGPAPPRFLRTRLDLNPTKPYPPIHTDPRGAYNKYAKAVQGEVIYVDVTKDGWLTEQWRERSEREALARLRGETEKQIEREIEAIRTGLIKRPVPRTAEGILLELWNALTETPMRELWADTFWSRYDWDAPEAEIHLKTDLQKGEDDKAPTLEDGTEIEWTREGVEVILANVGVQCVYNLERKVQHWTEHDRSYLVLGHGFFMIRSEDMLDWKPEETANKFEVLVTNHHDRVFGEMVKAQMMEERKKKEDEYRKRKIKEKKEKEEAIARGEIPADDKDKEKKKGEKEGKEGKDEKDGRDGKDKDEKKQDGKEDEAKKDEKKDKHEKEDKGDHEAKADKREPQDKAAPAQPDSPGSNTKVRDGDEIHPAAALVDPQTGVAAVVVPVDAAAEELDETNKHEVEAVVVGPDEAKKLRAEKAEKGEKGEKGEKIDTPGKGDKGDKGDKEQGGAKDKKDETGKKHEEDEKDAKDANIRDGEDKPGADQKKDDKAKAKAKNDKKDNNKNNPFDNMPEAEMLAKMIKASGGGPDGPLGMEDIKMAFKALEMAGHSIPGSLSGDKDGGKDGGEKTADGKKKPVIWTWHDSCERWRWKNYEVGLHEVGPGGWEERDWKEFADDRGCEDFMEDMAWEEKIEEDVHDWSC